MKIKMFGRKLINKLLGGYEEIFNESDWSIKGDGIYEILIPYERHCIKNIFRVRTYLHGVYNITPLIPKCILLYTEDLRPLDCPSRKYDCDYHWDIDWNLKITTNKPYDGLLKITDK